MRQLYLFLLLTISLNINAQNWHNLFDGDLSEFEQLNGTADYVLENGVLIGTSKTNIPNSFMATKKKYGDFILEFEVKVDAGLNSGVQFRSISDPADRNGRVHGYQLELETSPRKWTGGIYDEARRGWLYPITRNEKSQNAFKQGYWNHIRLEAIGDHINTFVNGIQCARLVDDLTAEGLIGFQVHGIGNNEALAGTQVMWRKARILTDSPEDYATTPDPNVAEISYLKNTLTEYEKDHGWRLLWDGKTTDGWRGAKSDEFPTKGWEINDGILKVLSSGGAESRNGGDIVTTKEFSDFEITVDFMYTKGANSGLKYFVDTELNKGEGSAIGLEFQILDDKNHPDAKQGKNGNRTIGSLYDLIRAGNLSESNRSTKRANGPNSWNRARVVVKGGMVEHWLNEIKVVEFDRSAQMFRAMVERSKYEKWENFGQIPAGLILLQDHGDEVSFKNIKIREF
ncbi:3-keto-disaccharide hydrolase [Portibacter lacus]|uniref:3-keto-alpha-glucoside-1,2-lyase/3-keto-2-hydroxy-glucal hydratase domain-containing protein n=1 Tax=Portibacter lacus TaxID=1099794 RepID=A0AA37SRT8_9BACT|nr:DUF1080 domain-containing protein [Portibacter lacus]GLR18399.1 hypothetical protein GCM10007940_30150 [Portibacter lacus]